MKEVIDCLSPTTISFVVLIREYANFSGDLDLNSKTTEFIIQKLLKISDVGWEKSSFNAFLAELYEESADEEICELYATTVFLINLI